MMRRTGAALGALLGGLRHSAGGGHRIGRGRAPGMSAARRLWLGGGVALVVAGTGLRLLGGGPPTGAGNQVTVALPPLASTAPLLAPAPDPGLTEDSPDGKLPIAGKDGRQAWQVYARPFDAKDKRPRVALLVTGLGLDQELTQAAMDRLPGAVTLGFDPYASGLKDAVAHARSLGHEALIGLPMEPPDYPRQDPGPLTLLVSLDATDNMARLDKLMGASTGYVGLVAIMGERFTAEQASLLPILQNLQQRGLMFVNNQPPDSSATARLASQLKLPWAAANRAIDAESDPAAIDQALAALEAAAVRNGVALGIAALSPALIDHATPWATALDGKGLALAPASAIANRQTIPPAAAQ